MHHILVVDDEEKIRAVIRKYAQFEGYQVTEAEDGMQAVELCKKENFDIIILDVMMPELDGFSTCREIHKFKDIPVLMLSARGEEYDRIHGFEIGVDDYVVKPFSPKELMMRVKVIISRHQNIPGQKHEVFDREGLSVDFTSRIVTVDGEKVDMSPKEYDLLWLKIEGLL